MSNDFPLSSDAFSGGARLTAQQSSEGDAPPLVDLLNGLAAGADGATALSGAVDYSAASAAVIAAANRQISTNAGAARTLTLPDFATAPDGWMHTMISYDAATQEYTIAAAGTDTINGIAGDIVLTTGLGHEWVQVMKVAGASGWFAIGGTLVLPA
jgi:hypothetical protein